MVVVMVHGFADTGRLFRSLGRTLSAEGHVCHAPTLSPRDARLGIPDLSGKLEAFIRANVPSRESFALVGFSMGALVARHYLQLRNGSQTTRVFFSIAGPHKGTVSAYLYPGEGTRQMRPGSVFLRELDAASAALDGLPLFTYRTPFDLMVNPASTTRLPHATEVVVWCPFHSLMPGDPRVKAHIAREISRLAQSGRTPPPGVVSII
jgi:triacylglycerol lipase